MTGGKQGGGYVKLYPIAQSLPQREHALRETLLQVTGRQERVMWAASGSSGSGGSQVFCLAASFKVSPNSTDFEGDIGNPPIPHPGANRLIRNSALQAQNSLTPDVAW